MAIPYFTDVLKTMLWHVNIQTLLVLLTWGDSTKSLMAKWLEQASQWHEMYCHDLEVMSSRTDLADLAELGMRGTSVLSGTWTKHLCQQDSNIYRMLFWRDKSTNMTLWIFKEFSFERWF